MGVSKEASGKKKEFPGKIKRERDILAAVVDTNEALAMALDRKGVVVYVSGKFEKLLGYSADEIIGSLIWESPVSAESSVKAKAVQDEILAGSPSAVHEEEWLTKAGEQLAITWSSLAIPEPGGKVKYVVRTSPESANRLFTEMDYQKRSHELAERVKELNCLYGISRLRERAELTLEQIIEGVLALIPPAWQYPEITCARIFCDDWGLHTENFKETKWKQISPILISGKQVGVLEVYYLKKKPTLQEGPFLAEERDLIDAIAERLGHIIEYQRKEKRILEYQHQLRRLASELVLTEERERRRIAIDLHDSIGQTLAAARIKLAGICESSSEDNLGDVVSLLDETIRVTRALTVELSPPVLYELGFEPTIEWLASNVQEEFGITTRFIHRRDAMTLEEDLCVLLYQAVKELLHNVVKHAQASEIEIEITYTDENVKLTVRDNGQGFDTTQLTPVNGRIRGFGLFSIRERLRHISGELVVESEPGKGTVVTLSAPQFVRQVEEQLKSQIQVTVPSSKRIRLLLADDHQITREGLRAVLSGYEDMEIVAEASGGKEAVRLACELHPDVVVMDVAMPDLSGVPATKQIVEKLPGIKVVALSMHSDAQFVVEMLRAGASGYLLKDCAQEDLAHAIRAVNAQLTFFSPGIANRVVDDYLERKSKTAPQVSGNLTPRETEVLQQLSDGMNSKQIAAKLKVSVKTVDVHRQHIMEKLDLHSVAELTRYAIQQGLVELEK